MRRVHPEFWSLNSLFGRVRDFGGVPDFVAYCRYLRPKGKVVLDVGAADFDSARCFLECGAERVVCVEPDFYPVPRDLRGRVVVYRERFVPEKHLGLDVDCAKFDIEGYEIELLPFLDDYWVRSICEVHSQYLIEKFLAKGWRHYRVTSVCNGHVITSLMVNQ